MPHNIQDDLTIDQEILSTEEDVFLDDLSSHTNEQSKNHQSDEIGFVGAWFILSNCAVGSGMLSIPFAFAKMGLILSLVVYIIVVFCSWFGMHLLANATWIMGVNSRNSVDRTVPRAYRELIRAIFGPIVTIFFNLFVLIYCFCILVGYLILIRGLIPPILRWLHIETVNFFDLLQSGWASLLILSLCIVFPIASIQNRQYFKYIATGTIICVLYFAFLIVFESSANPFEGVENLPCWRHEHDVHLFNNMQNLIIGLPIICFSFGGHLQSVVLYSQIAFSKTDENELLETNQNTDSKIKRWSSTTALSLLFLTLIYLLVGTVSYVCMIIPGKEPYGADILQHMINADPYDGFIQSASLSICVILIFSYPAYCEPARETLDSILSFFIPAVSTVSKSKRIAIGTGLIIAASYTTAVTIGDIKVVYGLIAATGSVLLQFILPVILYLFSLKYSETGTTNKTMLLMTFFTFIVGIATAVASCINIIVYSTNAE